MATPRSFSLPDEAEEALHRVVGQRAGRLIHENDLGVEAEHARDGDKLPLRNAQVAERQKRDRGRGRRPAEGAARRRATRRGETHALASRRALPMARFSAIESVAKRSSSCRMMPRPAWRAACGPVQDPRACPRAMISPVIRRGDAAKNPRQGAFACAVFAAKGMHLSRGQLPAHALEGDDAAVVLPDIAAFQHGDSPRAPE